MKSPKSTSLTAATPSSTLSSSSPHDDFAPLLERARAGEERAQALLYARFRPLVEWIVSRSAANRDDAEDLASDIWLLVLQKLPHLQRLDAFPGWLSTVARNYCCSYGRARTRRMRHLCPEAAGPDVQPELYPDSVSVEDTVTRALTLERNWAALPGLLQDLQKVSPSQASVFRRHHMEGIPLPDLAKERGEKPAMTRCYASRARAYLRGRLESL